MYPKPYGGLFTFWLSGAELFHKSIFSVKQRQVNERVKDYFSIAYIEFLLNAAILNDVYHFTMSIWSRN